MPAFKTAFCYQSHPLIDASCMALALLLGQSALSLTINKVLGMASKGPRTKPMTKDLILVN